MKIKGEHMARRRHGPGERSTQRPATRTRLQHNATRHDLQIRNQETNVRQVQNLGAMTQHERPEFGRRRKEENEPAFVAKNLRPERLPNPVGVLKESETVLEVGSGCDLYGAHGIVALVDDHRVTV